MKASTIMRWGCICVGAAAIAYGLYQYHAAPIVFGVLMLAAGFTITPAGTDSD